MAGVYIHIPFCKKACHYCNFFFTTSQNWYHDTHSAILQEIDYRKDFLRQAPLQSIYFGGGTPSMMQANDIQSIIDHIAKVMPLQSDAEITLEANPDNLTKEYLKALSKTSVNRLSIGIQSFHEKDLTWMNRAHNAIESRRCLDWAQSLGFHNLTIDLIFGLPDSTMEEWESNLQLANQMNIPHISCYALTVEPRTALGVRVKKKLEKAPNQDLQAEMFYRTHDYLEEQGYEHYEISNYGKKDHKAVHNSNYWEGTPYLGIGPSAHSFDGQCRSWNIAHMRDYIEGIQQNNDISEKEELSSEERYNEFIMISLRRKQGIDLTVLKKEHAPFYSYFDEIFQLMDSSKIERNGDHIRLKREGLVFADQIASTFFKV